MRDNGTANASQRANGRSDSMTLCSDRLVGSSARAGRGTAPENELNSKAIPKILFFVDYKNVECRLPMT